MSTKTPQQLPVGSTPLTPPPPPPKDDFQPYIRQIERHHVQHEADGKRITELETVLLAAIERAAEAEADIAELHKLCRDAMDAGYSAGLMGGKPTLDDVWAGFVAQRPILLASKARHD